YCPESGRSIDLSLADGEEKTDVVFTLTERAGPPVDYEKAREQISADFELAPGTYVLTWDPDTDCSAAACSYSQMSSEDVKARVKGNPPLKSAKPAYFACRFDGEGEDGCLVIVLDESKGTGKGWDTAYVDLNRNWDLSDESPMTLSRVGPSAQTEEFTVPLRQHDAEGNVFERPVRAHVETFSGDQDYVVASVIRNGVWRGLIDSNKGRVECAVLDDNCNGICGDYARYNDESEFVGNGDRIYIDTNGAGEVIIWPGKNSHCVNLVPVARIGSRFYKIAVSSLGDKVTIEPYTGEMGTLLVRGTDVEGRKAQVGGVSVVGNPGFYEFESADKPIQLPIGRYRISTCELSVQCARSRVLDLECRLHSPVEIKANEQTTVDVGGRLSPAIDPDRKNLVWKPGLGTDLNWDIKLGTNATVTRLGGEERYDSPPKLKFFNSKGKLVRTVNAGYT
ncbi:MAG: hypothetical protein ACP5R5_11875, partial [Armatimonadota bacterium]